MAGVRGAVGVVVLLLLAGCTAVGGQGDPTAPADPAAPTATSPSAPPPALPARPREVPIDGVDPCTLLTETQRAELGLDGRPVFDRSPSLLYPGEVPMCVTRGFEPRAVIVSVGLVATSGIGLFTSGALAADVQAVEVAGFPAAVARPTRHTEFCDVVVDVAPGQLVDIQSQDGGRQPPIPQEQLCSDAERVATAVMATLLSAR